MNRRANLLLLVGVVALLVACSPGRGDDQIEHNLASAIQEAGSGGTIRLSALTSAGWDRVVVLRPYASREQVAALLQFDAGDFLPTLRDDRAMLVFVKDRRVVEMGTFELGLIRFDGPGMALDRGEDALEVIDGEATDGDYAVPPGMGPRGPLCGPTGLDGCE